jgi:hypothetical protein
MKYIIIASLMFVGNAFAQDKDPTLNIKYGLGVIQKGDMSFGSVGYQRKIVDSLYQQYEGGLWVDRDRQSAGFASYQLGLKAKSGFVYGETMHGIGLITKTDGLLGGHFQFFHDLGVGIVSKDGSTFGIQMKHVSSAGINKPNIGRNFIAIKAGFSL